MTGGRGIRGAGESGIVRQRVAHAALAHASISTANGEPEGSIMIGTVGVAGGTGGPQRGSPSGLRTTGRLPAHHRHSQEPSLRTR